MVAIAKHLVPGYRVTLLQREHFNATRDPLTGLLNQIAFEERVEQEIKLGARYNKTFALLMLTINYMDEFEQSYGKSITNNLLIEFAKRLKSCVRSTDTLARLEDSSFVILLPDIASVRSIVKVVQNIDQHLLGPFVINGEVIELSPSIGVTVYPDDGDEHAQLTAKAEQAMSHVVNGSTRRYQFFSSSISEEAEQQIMIEDKLQYAIEHHAYNLHFESIHKINDKGSSLQELAVCWHDEVLNRLSIDQLDHHLESIEYSSFFCDLLLSSACRKLSSMAHKKNNSGYAGANAGNTLIVKISQEQFFDSQLVRRFSQILGQESTDTESIAIVVDEAAILHDMQRAIVRVRELKALGLKIVIDKFSAGLSYIGRFNRKLIDVIRVDGQLIENIDNTMDELSVVEGIVRIANNLQIKVVIPEINNCYQYQTLINLSGDYWQGSYDPNSESNDKYPLACN